MNADGSERHRLAPDGWSSRWSPTKNEIAYTVRDHGANLCVHDLATGSRRMVLKQPYDDIQWGFCWSSDGTRLCFKGSVGPGVREMAIVHAEGEPKGVQFPLPTKMGLTMSWPMFSWNGDAILASLQSKQDQNPQLYVFQYGSARPPQRLEGQDPKRDNAAMCWSPDGKKITFVSRDPRAGER
jgi:Tol biopolymer transport system component